MRRRFLIIFFILMLGSLGANAATRPVQIRRICQTDNDNTLYWYRSSDTCSSFMYYIIWARNGISGGFNPIDTIYTKSVESYRHVCANCIAAPKWNYFIQSFDLCGPNFSAASDTLPVDIYQDSLSFIDSVSVDILTNNVLIGWHHNTASDFDFYIPLVFDGVGQYNKMLPPGTGTRDTFFIDNTSNPSAKAYRYDLNTQDSCGNPGTFGYNPHQTIFLTTQIDTCKKTCVLTWTPYGFPSTGINGKPNQVGWKSVLKYYVFKKINTGSFTLLDSVGGSILSYLDNIVIGQQIQYYVRAIKDTSIIVSSSSNSSTVSSRLRIDPLNTELINVSVDPISNNQVILTIKNGTGEEWSSFQVFRSSDSLSNFLKTGSMLNIGATSTLYSYTDVVDASVSRYFYSIHANNLCAIDVLTSKISNTILLRTNGALKQNMLYWNSYNYWQSGVEKYRIYRGVKQNDGSIMFGLLDSVPFSVTGYADNSVPEKVEGQGLCYYVEAVQNTGTTYTETSSSNNSCVIGDLVIYIPNAFNPSGVNILFRPEGSFIDYKNSSMGIYNRWGGKVIEIFDLTTGWNGKDMHGQISAPGVYLYNIKIISTNGKEQSKSGLVTLLN